MDPIEDCWYWDRRINKAYRPIEHDDETVTFVTVRHREEVTDAIECDAFVPLEEIGLDQTVFDLIDSFRLPSDEALPTPEDT